MKIAPVKSTDIDAMLDLNNEMEYAYVCEISNSFDKLRIACSNRRAGKYRDDADIIAIAA
ncbi:hypothetical protein [Burkholderia cepacia]|uniref:hypothetical protein n=1 Tax=Burkholderia cepacia TaxID=292 RepID=UPI00075AD0DD|nr:hypothetical protein [Burkholderia cepacia]KVH35140.1 hypothetical protein WS88_19035 [Burkholderia cepacia]